MRRVQSLYQTSVGKKLVMAVSGLILFLFVVAHMLGNLKIYQGAEKFDAYAHFLREVGYPALGHGQLLWLLRIALLGSVGIHMVAALQLYVRNLKARRTGYRQYDDLSFSYASRTMRWGGVILLAFVVYHVLHLTVGSTHPEFSDESPYANVIRGFRVWWVSLAYGLAMVPLGLHLYHGLWSATQTLALRSRRVQRWRRGLAAAVALVVVVGNVSVPLSVLLGLVR